MDYNRAVALATRLIEKNGRLVKVQRLETVVTDVTKPWKGSDPAEVDQEVIVPGVFLPHSGTIDLGVLLIDDELLKRCEQVVMVAGGAVDLTQFHRLEDSGTFWRIEWVRELKPADISVLVVFGVKR